MPISLRSRPSACQPRHLRGPWLVPVLLALTMLSPACSPDRDERHNPVAPSRTSAALASASGSTVMASSTPGAPAAAAVSGRSVPLPLPDASSGGALVVAFPPRNESFEFRQELERKYRDGLGRPAGPTFVDAEGDVVWTQEYLRYRVNGCDHLDAVERVLQQVAGAPGAAVCADVSTTLVAFPPRDQSFAFREVLERRYRDGLGRSPVSTSVDLEGAIVWTQEYLRYRVNACSHAIAVARVFQQIDGGPIGPVCVVVPEPDPAPLAGLWRGTSDYINAPFTMDLQVRGRLVYGWYQDQKDRGSVDADYDGGSDIRFHVYFGDTGFFMDGRIESPDLIRGTFRVAVLGNRQFWFEMRR